MNNNDKLELLNYLAFMHNKLTRLSLRLFVQGEDTTAVDKARKKLDNEIDKMRVEIAKDWQGSADALLQQLRGLNEQAQTVIRDLDSAADKAAKVTKVLKLLDKGLQLVKGLIP